MSCDPVTELDVDRGEQLAKCPSCGRSEHLSLRPLFVLTGASGAGKSTVYPLLPRLVPECAVFETDLILDYAASTWDNLRSTWLMVASGVAANGRSTLLCGSFLPEQLDALPARRFVGPIHFANLDVSEAEQAERLRARPSWRGWDAEKIREHQAFARHLRAIRPTFSTTGVSPQEVAQEVAAWTRQHLSRVALG